MSHYLGGVEGLSSLHFHPESTMHEVRQQDFFHVSIHVFPGEDRMDVPVRVNKEVVVKGGEVVWKEAAISSPGYSLTRSEALLYHQAQERALALAAELDAQYPAGMAVPDPEAP